MTSLKLKKTMNKTLVQQRIHSPVHWHIMMNTMEQKVQSQENRMIGQEVVDVEEEPVQPILQYRPDEVAKQEAEQSLDDRVRRHKGQDGEWE